MPDKAGQPLYHRGRPYHWVIARRRMLVGNLWLRMLLVIGFAVPSVVFVASCIELRGMLWDHRWLLLGGGAAILLFLFVSWATFCVAMEIITGDAAIVPWFERRIGTGKCQCRVDRLGAHWEELDGIARDSGVQPLSDFGFLDFWALRPLDLRWHDPADALRSIDVILTCLRNEAKPRPDLIGHLSGSGMRCASLSAKAFVSS